MPIARLTGALDVDRVATTLHASTDALTDVATADQLLGPEARVVR